MNKETLIAIGCIVLGGAVLVTLLLLTKKTIKCNCDEMLVIARGCKAACQYAPKGLPW